jgi:hypothetical protein
MAMKLAILFIFTLPVFASAQTGVDCATAIPLTLDGVCRNYSTSSAVGSSVVCTSYTGTSPVTYFSFTTNSTPDKVLIDVTAPGGGPCEVALYSSGCSTMYSSGSMCFDDGKGLWSFGYNFPIQANTTYKLRIKTASAGSITLCAKNYTPLNNTCNGATSIGTNLLFDNNACNSPSSLTPSLLCAYTLENTAFYQFYVASDGFCVVNISSINCDNGNGNNSNGFQAGFFEGSCSSLNYLGCDSNSNAAANSFLQFTTPSLTAGTKVILAIDGIQGSNCSYNISGINIMNVLSADLESFNGWESGSANLLKWTILHETEGGSYLVERSQNGKDFYPIGRLKSQVGKSRTSYSFEDRGPMKISYYRIRQEGGDGKISLSPIIVLKRKEILELEVNIINPVINNSLDIMMHAVQKGQLSYAISSISGQTLSTGVVNCVDGTVHLQKDISSFAKGKYFVSVFNNQQRLTRSFVKTN